MESVEIKESFWLSECLLDRNVLDLGEIYANDETMANSLPSSEAGKIPLMVGEMETKLRRPSRLTCS